jgi:hypothetical protein
LTLLRPASAITVGLGFQAQLQSVYLDAGNPTVQGQRKAIPAVTFRLETSRGLKAGTNQPDGSTLSPPQLDPPWNQLTDVEDLAVPPFGSDVVPLYTGDVRVVVHGAFEKPGQVALQQDYPLPMQVLAMIPEVDLADIPQPAGPPGAQRGRR